MLVGCEWLAGGMAKRVEKHVLYTNGQKATDNEGKAEPFVKMNVKTQNSDNFSAIAKKCRDERLT